MPRSYKIQEEEEKEKKEKEKKKNRRKEGRTATLLLHTEKRLDYFFSVFELPSETHLVTKSTSFLHSVSVSLSEHLFTSQSTHSVAFFTLTSGFGWTRWVWLESQITASEVKHQKQVCGVVACCCLLLGMVDCKEHQNLYSYCWMRDACFGLKHPALGCILRYSEIHSCCFVFLNIL